MESETFQNRIETSDLHITSESLGYLSVSAKWAKFLSIIGFIFVGLIVIIAFFAGSIISSMANLYGAYVIDGMGMTITIIYLVIAVIYFFPPFFCYRFAVNLQKAIAAKDTPKLTESLKNLRNFWQYIGILTVIGLCLLVIGIVIVIITAAITL